MAIETWKPGGTRASWQLDNAGSKRQGFVLSAECYPTFLKNKTKQNTRTLCFPLWEKVIPAQGRKFPSMQGYTVKRKSPSHPTHHVLLRGNCPFQLHLTESSLYQWFPTRQDFATFPPPPTGGHWTMSKTFLTVMARGWGVPGNQRGSC